MPVVPAVDRTTKITIAIGIALPLALFLYALWAH